MRIFYGLILIVCVAAACCWVVGCQSAAKKRAAAEAKAIQNFNYSQSDLAITGQEAVNAMDEATKLRDMLGESPQNALMRAHDEAVIGSLGKVIPGIHKADVNFGQMRKDYFAEKKRADAAEDNRDKPLTDKLNWLMVATVVLIGAGVVAGAVSKRYPIPGLDAGTDVAVGAGVMIAVIFGIKAMIIGERVFVLIASIGGAVMLLIAVAYVLWKNRKAATVRRAFKEVVATVEAVKPQMARPELVAQAANAIQTPTTAALVQKAKGDAAPVAMPPVADTPDVVPT